MSELHRLRTRFGQFLVVLLWLHVPIVTFVAMAAHRPPSPAAVAAILLAAATPAAAGDVAVDLGAGVGAAGLALAQRVPGLAVRLVELDPQLAQLAGGNPLEQPVE